MTPELAWIFSIFLAPCKAKAQFGQLPHLGQHGRWSRAGHFRWHLGALLPRLLLNA